MKLQANRVYRDVEGRVIWTVLRIENFSVKSFYYVLEPSDCLLFPRSIIWRSCVPPKMAFFAWEATWGKPLTFDQVQRRGFSFANKCFLCHSEEKTIDHILFYCAKMWIQR